MGAFFTWLASAAGNLFVGLFGAAVDAIRAKRQDQDRVAAHEDAAVADAAQETQDAIADTADARSALPGAATDADELARRLRARKTGADGGH